MDQYSLILAFFAGVIATLFICVLITSLRKHRKPNQSDRKLNQPDTDDFTDYKEESVELVNETLNQAIRAFVQAIDAKDEYTRGHSSRVAEYSKMIASRMNLGSNEIRDVYRMGLLHDVGKIGIDDAIIRKSSGLSEEEYTLVKSHPLMGDKILQNITSMPNLHIGARWHHERYDGLGYPDGLLGDEIPLYARIITVADSYDAMASNRSYRQYLPQDVIRTEISKGKGGQFDPEIADIMLEIIDEDKEYKLHE